VAHFCWHRGWGGDSSRSESAGLSLPTATDNQRARVHVRQRNLPVFVSVLDPARSLHASSLADEAWVNPATPGSRLRATHTRNRKSATAARRGTRHARRSALDRQTGVSTPGSEGVSDSFPRRRRFAQGAPRPAVALWCPRPVSLPSFGSPARTSFSSRRRRWLSATEPSSARGRELTENTPDGPLVVID
jgi:hypothetical protein